MKKSIEHSLKFQLPCFKIEKQASRNLRLVGEKVQSSLPRQALKQKPLSLKPNLFRNEQGLSHFSLVLSVLIISAGYLVILKALNENLRIKEKANLLLCQKEYELSKRSYIKRMSQLNIVIKAAFNLRFIPVTAPYATKLQEGAKKIQQLYHLSEIKKPFVFKHCSPLIRVTYFKNLPYKARKKVLLKRRLDGTVPVRKEKWNEIIWSKRKRIFIKSQFTLKSRFQKAPEVERKLYSKEALRNWRESYGSSFLSS